MHRLCSLLKSLLVYTHVCDQTGPQGRNYSNPSIIQVVTSSNIKMEFIYSKRSSHVTWFMFGRGLEAEPSWISW